MNCIHNAVKRRNYLQFDILVAQKIGLNKSDAQGLTPLMKCCHEPNKKNATEMVRLLLRQSADIAAVDKRGRNVLMHAALVGNAPLVRLLLSDGEYDPAARDYYGNAAIHYAAMSADIDTIEAVNDFMKENRLKADLRNDDGFTPLLIACSQGHVIAARYLHASAGCSLILRDGRRRLTAREWLDRALVVPDYCDPFGHSFDPEECRRRRADGGATADDEEDASWSDGGDECSVRLFVYMKDGTTLDGDCDDDDVLFPPSSSPGGRMAITERPPWDSSTNVNTPPRHVHRFRNGRTITTPAHERRPWSSASLQFSGAGARRSAVAVDDDARRPLSALSVRSEPTTPYLSLPSSLVPPCKHFRGRPTLLPFRRPPTHEEVQSWRTASDVRATLCAPGADDLRCYESVSELAAAEAAPELHSAVRRIYGIG